MIKTAGKLVVVLVGINCCFDVVANAAFFPFAFVRPSVAPNAWKSTSVGTNVPVARWIQTAVWAGTKMIVWGGSTTSSSTGVNTGGVYDPETDTWTATSTGTNVPSARTQMLSTWTGSEMLIWGGNTGSYTNTGAAYNMASNSWLTMSTTSAPSGRVLGCSVWTGATGSGNSQNRMIVWGGMVSGPAVTATGGLYQRPSNTWSATQTTNAPSARMAPTCVWTGATGNVNTQYRMIVWGGATNATGTTFTNTGAVYYPEDNTWTTMSVTNAPSARWGHSGVWIGSKLMVFGGSTSVYFNDGGLYDPLTDIWTTFTSTGVPAIRGEHSTAWTGSKVLVWGGRDGSSAGLTSGGAYDPALNSWTTMATTDMPAGRTAHTGVWSGTELLIFGGTTTYAAGGRINTGGRYGPP